MKHTQYKGINKKFKKKNNFNVLICQWSICLRSLTFIKLIFHWILELNIFHLIHENKIFPPQSSLEPYVIGQYTSLFTKKREYQCPSSSSKKEGLKVRGNGGRARPVMAMFAMLGPVRELSVCFVQEYRHQRRPKELELPDWTRSTRSFSHPMCVLAVEWALVYCESSKYSWGLERWLGASLQSPCCPWGGQCCTLSSAMTWNCLYSTA